MKVKSVLIGVVFIFLQLSLQPNLTSSHSPFSHHLAASSAIQKKLLDHRDLPWSAVGAKSEEQVRTLLRGGKLKPLFLSAQFYVLSLPELSFVVKIEKTKEETDAVFQQWYGEIPSWGKKVHESKAASPLLILNNPYLYKEVVYPIKRLENVTLSDGRIVTVDIQKKADFVLTEAVAHFYRLDQAEKVKEILNAYIRTLHKMWSLGLFEAPLISTVNYGVEMEGDKIQVKLFDLGELTTDGSIAVQRIRDESDFSGSWAVSDRTVPSSMIRLTDEKMARWFQERLKEEITVEKFRRLWPNKHFSPCNFHLPPNQAEKEIEVSI